MAAPGVTAASPHTSRLRKYVIGVLVAMAVIYLAICVFLYLKQDQMVFVPPAEYEKVTPLNLGIPFEDLHIPVNGSDQIHAWWIPASSPSDKVMLSFHGNGSVLEDNITLVLRAKSRLAPLPRLPTKQMELIPLHEIGLNVLAIDYRGLGSSSSGLPNEKRVYDDARAAYTYLTIKRGVHNRDIILEGHSLGTGPATEMAREHDDVGGLILVSPFTSTPDIVKVHSEFWWAWPFPYRLLSHNRFDNLSKIDSVHVPVLIAVGTSDDITIPEMAKALYRRANEPKRLYLAPGAGHNSIWETEGLQNQISAFIQTLH
jgi:pimeloyl-ACP methyl ester carboxylesterase